MEQANFYIKIQEKPIADALRESGFACAEEYVTVNNADGGYDIHLYSFPESPELINVLGGLLEAAGDNITIVREQVLRL